jgi:putative ABC transport system permease protein
MTGLRAFFARLRSVLRTERGTQLPDEISEHIELLTEDYMRRGLPEHEARFAARRELGNVTQLQQEYHEQSGLPLLENFLFDARFALRTLRRNPAFSLNCIAILAVGIGSMITVSCLLSTLLWKPLPYPKPEQLFALKELDPRKGVWPFSQPTLIDMSERTRSLANVAAYSRQSLALTGEGEPQTIQAAAVTPSAFTLFGIKPITGHFFVDARQTVVISRELWLNKWRMSPEVIGRPIALDGHQYVISGVADLPADLMPGVALFLPLIPQASESRSAHELQVVARLAPNVSFIQAQAELNAIASSIARQNALTNAGWGMQLVPLRDEVNGPRTASLLWMIFSAVALLWLLACANVAGLQMARMIARRHEISTRLALGAGRGRLFAQTLTESLVLSVAGSLLGIATAQTAISLLRNFAAGLFPRLAVLQIDGITVLLAVACLLVSTLLFALLSGRTIDLQGGREATRRDRGRDGLVVVQVALASLLLLGATLLLESFLRLQNVDPGFNPDKILAVHADVPSRRLAFIREAIRRLSVLAEVESAAATNTQPFSGSGTANRFRLESESISGNYRSAAWRAVTPEFFTTLELHLEEGRLFTDADTNGSLEVVIISESMARQFWPNENPIGKHLLWGKSGNPKTIVGIVSDLRDLAVDTQPIPIMFRPFAQLSDAPMTLLLRTRGDPAAAIADVRRTLWAIDAGTALEFQPVRQAMSDSMLKPRAALFALAAFACIALVTAAFGLYGLISYRVSQRTQEIGIRLALGSPGSAVRWSVQKRCLLLVCAGLLIGLPVAYGLSNLITALLYETQPTEISAYAAVFLLVVIVAIAASYAPARRAARLDPASAIRHE